MFLQLPSGHVILRLLGGILHRWRCGAHPQVLT